MCEHSTMRQVLVTLFWVWFAVAVSIYGYRLYRRITQGSKATREAKANASTGRTAGLGDTASGAPGSGRSTTPPLPRSRAAKVSESEPAAPTDGSDGSTTPPTVAGARDLTPTVVQALWGISLPCDLVPIADGGDAANTSGHRVVFTTRTATVPTVAAGLADELGVLGYQVSNAATGTSGDRHRLIATRTDTTVSVAIGIDESGAVAAEITT